LEDYLKHGCSDEKMQKYLKDKNLMIKAMIENQ